MPTIHMAIVMFLLIALAMDSMAQSGRATRYQSGDWISIGNFHYVTSFSEGNRYVYIGTTHGVLRYDQITDRFDYPYTRGSGLVDDYVLNVYWVESKSELWVFTRQGIDVISALQDRWQHIPRSEEIFHQSIRRIDIGESTGAIWVRMNNGATYRIDKFALIVGGQSPITSIDIRWKDTNEIPRDMPMYALNSPWMINRLNSTLEDANFREYPFTVQFTDSYHHMWIGTWGAGFIKADATTKIGEVIRVGPMSNPIGAIFKDSSNFWFGGANSWYSGPPSVEGEPGISRWGGAWDDWYHMTPSEEYTVQDVAIYSIDSDDQRCWFGTERGVVHYNYRTGLWKEVDDPQLGNSRIFQVLSDDSTVWIASNQGLFTLTNPTAYVREKVPFAGDRNIPVYSLSKFKKDLYAGTENGLIRLDIPRKKIYYYNNDGKTVDVGRFHYSRVYTMDVDSDGRLYYADDFGIYQFDIQTHQLNQLPKLGLHATSITRTIEAGDEYLWVGFNDGLGRLNKATEEWEFYSEEDGLSDNLIYDIIAEPEYIWCATRRGVTRFHFRN